MGFFTKSKEKEEARVQKIKQDLIEYYTQCRDNAIKDVRVPKQFLKTQSIGFWIDKVNLYTLLDLDHVLKKVIPEKIRPDQDFEYFKYPKTWLNIIPIKDIRYFKRVGQVRTETKISGGGGGGSSISGAVVGGLIAGTAGAVIGSRKKVEPIKSETITYDSRGVALAWRYQKDGEWRDNGLHLDSQAYEILMELIPEKQYDYVMSQKLPKEQPTQTKSTKEKLTELKEMLDDGLITQEEFDAKKQQLLENM